MEADLNLLVADALEVLNGAPEINVVQKLHLQPKLKLDRQQFSSVITNLLLNAREALGPGGEVRVETTQSNGWAVLSVADNGCGMSPAFVKTSLFRPFQTTKKKGLGIGMFQSKMIVEAHRGKIQVESEPGAGTTFRVMLPVGDSTCSRAGRRFGNGLLKRPRNMKPRLLIVDDDETIRTQMKWALTQDYDVHFAENRKGALEAFEANPPSVTLLDLGLPPRPNECDEGLAALSEILAVDGPAKVIIVSGQGEKRNAIEAVGAGAYDFLCKPVEIEELRLLLRRCIHVVELEKEYRRVTTEPAIRCV